MKLIISNEIAQDYPELKIGIIIAKEIENNKQSNQLEKQKFENLTSLRKNFSIEKIKENIYISTWRETYRSFGVNPKKHTPTAENFIIRLLKGSNFPNINTAVDTYLLLETEYLLPIGGYDIDKLSGDLYLRYSQGNEDFIALGRQDVEKTKEHEIIYSDDNRILTRRWNYRDCDYTKITPDSKNIALFTEAPTNSISLEYLLDSVKKLKSYIESFCGGNVNYQILNVKENLELKIF